MATGKAVQKDEQEVTLYIVKDAYGGKVPRLAEQIYSHRPGRGYGIYESYTHWGRKGPETRYRWTVKVNKGRVDAPIDGRVFTDRRDAERQLLECATVARRVQGVKLAVLQDEIREAEAIIAELSAKFGLEVER